MTLRHQYLGSMRFVLDSFNFNYLVLSTRPAAHLVATQPCFPLKSSWAGNALTYLALILKRCRVNRKGMISSNPGSLTPAEDAYSFWNRGLAYQSSIARSNGALSERRLLKDLDVAMCWHATTPLKGLPFKPLRSIGVCISQFLSR